MNHIQKFINNDLNVTIRVIQVDGVFKFIAKDVAEALKYTDTDQAIRKHCKRVETYPVEMTGQVRHIKVIPESDLYRLIMKSQMPKAEEFQDWVFEEVLPSIRKHGAYMTPQTIQNALRDPQMIINLLEALRDESEARKFYQGRDAIYGNRIPFGMPSDTNGKPRVQPVRGYLRSVRDGFEFIPDAIQLKLF